MVVKDRRRLERTQRHHAVYTLDSVTVLAISVIEHIYAVEVSMLTSILP